MRESEIKTILKKKYKIKEDRGYPVGPKIKSVARRLNEHETKTALQIANKSKRLVNLQIRA